MSNQDIPIAFQNGRVYHDGLTLAYKDIRLRTKGSVGMDQTISLVAEIPIQDDWIEGERWLQGLKGQSISLPVSGTVTQPKIDKRAIQQISQQLIRQNAGNAINQAIEDKLGGSPQRVVNDRLNSEVNRLRDKVNNQLQEDVGKKLENEFRNGLDKLFKRGGGNK